MRPFGSCGGDEATAVIEALQLLMAGGTRAAALVLASALALAMASSGPAGAQSGSKGAVIVRPTVMAKIYMRPLLRAGRVQYCLKGLGHYDGRINGRMTLTTLRGLRRFRDDLRLRSADVEQDWAIHTALWRRCRENWVAHGGSLDRFGMAVAVPAVAKAGATRSGMETSSASIGGPPPANSAEPPAVGVCLSPELRDILGRAHGQRIAVPACEAPCLPKPPAIDSEDAQSYERAHGFSWCRSCIPFAGNLGIDDITRIEKAGNLTLCPTPRRQVLSRAQEAQGLMIDRLRGTRTVFRRDVLPSETHGGFAVIVSLANYANGLPQRPRSERDAAGMHAVLVERLGFRSNRVIELRDPGRDELEGIFGRAGSAKGLLSERLKEAAGSQLFIYVSGLGAFADDDGAAYILPSDAVPHRERSRGFALETLYRNAAAIGAGAVTIVLEMEFSGDPRGGLVPPNAPSLEAVVLPPPAIRGLTVLTAGDRDQRLLEDPELGLSLFTRHLIAAMSGQADLAPIGNGDGTVDTAEAFVHAAERTSYVARKVYGVLQRPTMSQGRPNALVRLGAQITRQ